MSSYLIIIVVTPPEIRAVPVCQLVENLCSRHVLPALLVELPQQVEHSRSLRLLCRCRLQEVLNERRPETEHRSNIGSAEVLFYLTERSLSVSFWLTSHW